ncbi:MAG: hypothetical protein J7L72_08155 [Candidatus Aminicenantes bacterium]|nr:hypothetical protein [Candidatus Aminicenantes bacterium]
MPELPFSKLCALSSTGIYSGKSWPILYAFDPSARGKVPVERFKEAAEKFNYIIAGSHNSRNGPWEDVFSAMHALWDDTNSRLSIDKKSVYTTGFSGGARAAAAFSKVINHPVAGIPHRIHFFEGTHNWPPSDVFASALEWMEIMRMKKNVIPKDQNKIACSPFISSLKDISEIKESLTRLEQSEAYKQFLQNGTKRNQRESNIIRTCRKILDNIEKSPEDYKDLEKLFAQMSLYFLLNEYQKQDSLEDKSMAIRLLNSIGSRAAQTGNQHLKNNHPIKAVILYEIAVKASEENKDMHKYILFDLAQAYALNKDEKSALRYLDTAVENGFSDLPAVQKNPYFEGMRESPLYKDIIVKIKKKACS